MTDLNDKNNKKDRAKREWIISDTHFGHYLMQTYCSRPKDFEERIIKHWKRLVEPEDIVYHLGDVIWGTKEKLTYILSQLPGTKVLVKGNHDWCHSDTWFYNAGFSLVCYSIMIRKNIVLSHWPIEIQEDQVNIHGHFHNNPVEKWEKGLVSKVTKNHFLYAIENHNYEPLLLESVLQKKNIPNTLDLINSSCK